MPKPHINAERALQEAKDRKQRAENAKASADAELTEANQQYAHAVQNMGAEDDDAYSPPSRPTTLTPPEGEVSDEEQ